MVEEKRKGEKPPARQATQAAPSQRPTAAPAKAPKGIIRFIGRDVDASLPVKQALKKIKGIGHSLASTLAFLAQKNLGISPRAAVGDLSEQQIDAIEAIAREPVKYGARWFQLNRARDLDTGEAKQLIGPDLVFAIRQDVEREKATRSWRGWRHGLGQKVRGQHTRTTGRSGMTVGVLKKAVKAAKAAAAAEAQEKRKGRSEPKTEAKSEAKPGEG